mgnify:CR=1 FL=1
MSVRALLAAVAAALLSVACSSGDIADVAGGDVDTEIQYSGALGQYRGIVYVPGSVDPKRAVPLLVVLHGANTTAEQQRAANLFDPVARREGFIVMYPDHETDSQLGLHPLQAWRFWDPLEMQRGVGDSQAISELTRQVMDGWNVDRERVYLAGMSAGGWMTSIMGATYPDIYAAIGVAEGGGYAIGLAGFSQPLGGTLLPPQVTATLARAAMGANARVVPVINFQGSADTAAPPATGAQLVQQWLMTNNLVVSGGLSAPFPLAPSETVSYTPGGERHPYAVDIYRDAQGCRVLEQVRIEGMEHFWPGGSDDPKLKGFTDPLAPNAAEMTWAFLRRFRLSDTAPPCTEAAP